MKKVNFDYISYLIIRLSLLISLFVLCTGKIKAQLNFIRSDISGNNSKSIAIGDINGDGFKDLVVASSNSNSVLVFTNTGTGSFTKVGQYTTGSFPYNIALGDLNGDGKLDFAVVNWGSNTVSIFTNTGSGGFSLKKDYSTGRDPFSVSIEDLNGDGLGDFVVANYNSNTVSVFINTGNGNFGTEEYTTGLSPNSIAIGDMNGDGKLDLATANSNSNSISVFTNTGNGSFSSKIDYATGTYLFLQSITMGDVDGDGKLDIVVTYDASNIVHTVLVCINSGYGSFKSKINYDAGVHPYSVAIGDLNGDGKLDLATANSGSNTVSAFINTGYGRFGDKIDYNTGSQPYSIAIGDLNGDGKLDLATANYADDINAITLYLSSNITAIDQGLTPKNATGDSFSIYPNPNKGKFTVSNKLATHYQIATIGGSIVQTGLLTEGSNTIETNLPSGFYIISAGHTSLKLLVE